MTSAGTVAAARIAARLAPDRAGELVAAAWLHDIGYAPGLAVSGFHPADGARFVRSQGFPELVVSLVAFHTGAVIEAIAPVPVRLHYTIQC